jgi:hypothetical protein
MFMMASGAFADKLACTHYLYPEVPFITITMNIQEDGHIDSDAIVYNYGTTRHTNIQEGTPTGNQLYNLTVGAGSPNGELFLEIYKPSIERHAVSSYSAKLINPNSPGMKEMAGHCERTIQMR